MKQKEICLVALQTVLLVGITLFSVVPFSCKVTTEGIEIIGGDYSAPDIEEVDVIDEKTVTMTFSDSVNVRDVVVSPVLPGISDSDVHSETEDLSPAIAAAAGEFGHINATVKKSEDGKNITFILEEGTVIGKSYEVYGTVEDKIGNTLTFCVPFTGYNSKVPKIIMTEAQIKYAKATVKNEAVYRGEYIEFLALEEGNLAGLELCSAADGEAKTYAFPAIEVKKGELFLVHFRTAGDGCINEDGDDLNAATAPHSAPEVRDLWWDNTSSHFNDSSDVLILRNTVDGSIMDALMYAVPEALEWKPAVGEAALEVFNEGFYVTCDISGACNSKGVSPLKSLTRVEGRTILEALLAGEEVEWPVAGDGAWEVMAVTPGVV